MSCSRPHAQVRVRICCTRPGIYVWAKYDISIFLIFIIVMLNSEYSFPVLYIANTSHCVVKAKECVYDPLDLSVTQRRLVPSTQERTILAVFGHQSIRKLRSE